MIIMTDGNPTTYGYPVHTGSPNEFDNLDEGIKSANGVKADGTRIVGVGIGNDLNAANLALISGPALGEDYYTTSFGDLGTTLGDIARKVCHSTVAVTKLVNGVKQPDWVFNGNGSPSKTVDDGVTTLQWDLAEPAVRSITEVPRDGFTFASASCADRVGAVAVTPVTNGVSLEVGPTDHVTCTFTNDPHPQIAVDKTGPASAAVGTVATYTITVANPGALPLHDVTVSDPACSPPQRTAGDANDNGTLDPGETWTYSCHRTITAQDGPAFQNTATASGSAYGTTVTDDGSHVLSVLEPSIALTKNGPDAAHVGDDVTYTLVVSNPSGAALFGIHVSDPLCSAPEYVSGDANTNAALDPAESWTYTCTHEIASSDPDPFVNTATAVGSVLSEPNGDAPAEPVTATAQHSVDIIHPEIALTMSADPISGNPGTPVTYTYVVTNTGDTPLSGVTVKDDKLGDVAGGFSLDPGESRTFTKSTVMTAQGAIMSIGTASGTDGLQKAVDASAVAMISVVLGNTVERPLPRPRPRPLPTTGAAGTDPLARAAAAFLCIGVALVFGGVIGPRKRPSA